MAMMGWRLAVTLCLFMAVSDGARLRTRSSHSHSQKQERGLGAYVTSIFSSNFAEGSNCLDHKERTLGSKVDVCVECVEEDNCYYHRTDGCVGYNHYYESTKQGWKTSKAECQGAYRDSDKLKERCMGTTDIVRFDEKTGVEHPCGDFFRSLGSSPETKDLTFCARDSPTSTSCSAIGTFAEFFSSAAKAKREFEELSVDDNDKDTMMTMICARYFMQCKEPGQDPVPPCAPVDYDIPFAEDGFDYSDTPQLLKGFHEMDMASGWDKVASSDPDDECYHFRIPSATTNWAVIVGATPGRLHENKFHGAQSLVGALASYQQLVQSGFPKSRIVMIAFDDLLAAARDSDLKGTIPFMADKKRHSIGPDMAKVAIAHNKDVPFDYTEKHVTPDMLKAIMKGDKAAAEKICGNGAVAGRCTSRVLESTVNDNIFVFFSGHGKFVSNLPDWLMNFLEMPWMYMGSNDELPHLSSTGTKFTGFSDLKITNVPGYISAIASKSISRSEFKQLWSPKSSRPMKFKGLHFNLQACHSAAAFDLKAANGIYDPNELAELGISATVASDRAGVSQALGENRLKVTMNHKVCKMSSRSVKKVLKASGSDRLAEVRELCEARTNSTQCTEKVCIDVNGSETCINKACTWKSDRDYFSLTTVYDTSWVDDVSRRIPLGAPRNVYTIGEHFDNAKGRGFLFPQPNGRDKEITFFTADAFGDLSHKVEDFYMFPTFRRWYRLSALLTQTARNKMCRRQLKGGGDVDIKEYFTKTAATMEKAASRLVQAYPFYSSLSNKVLASLDIKAASASFEKVLRKAVEKALGAEKATDADDDSNAIDDAVDEDPIVQPFDVVANLIGSSSGVVQQQLVSMDFNTQRQNYENKLTDAVGTLKEAQEKLEGAKQLVASSTTLLEVEERVNAPASGASSEGSSGASSGPGPTPKHPQSVDVLRKNLRELLTKASYVDESDMGAEEQKTLQVIRSFVDFSPETFATQVRKIVSAMRRLQSPSFRPYFEYEQRRISADFQTKMMDRLKEACTLALGARASDSDAMCACLGYPRLEHLSHETTTYTWDQPGTPWHDEVSKYIRATANVLKLDPAKVPAQYREKVARTASSDDFIASEAASSADDHLVDI